MRARSDHRAGPQARERSDHRAGGDGRALDMAAGPNLDIVADRDPRPEKHAWADHHVPAEAGIVTEIDGAGIDEGGAVPHRLRAQALLEDGLGPGQLHARVGADELVRIGLHIGAGKPLAAGDGDDVGQAILGLGVVVADLVHELEQMRAVRHHDARIAQESGLLGQARVAGLDDGLEGAVRADDEPAVLAGVLGREAEHHDRGIGRGAARLEQHLEGLGPDQRGVAIEHQDIALIPVSGEGAERRARRLDRVGGAALGGLDHRRHRRHGGRHLRRLRPDHHDHPVGLKGFEAGQYMLDHRPPGQGVHHLGQLRFHPPALAGGEDDRGGFSPRRGGLRPRSRLCRRGGGARRAVGLIEILGAKGAAGHFDERRPMAVRYPDDRPLLHRVDGKVATPGDRVLASRRGNDPWNVHGRDDRKSNRHWQEKNS